MKSICIGLVFTHSYAYHRRVMRGIRHYVEERPQWLLTSLVPERQSLRVPGRFRPDGLITAMDTKQMVRSLSAWRRPVVDVSAVLSRLPFPRVRVDNVRVGQLAAAHFLERGLRHLGFVGPPDHLYAIERRAAFCQAVREAGRTVACYEGRAHLAFDVLGRRSDLDPAVARWLHDLPKPVGVFLPNDFWGVQVAEACRRAELRVPEDVALLGVDDDDLYCELTRPPLSSIILPTEQIGYQAAALLDRLLAGEKPPSESILLPPTGVATRRSTEVLAIDDPDIVAAVRYIREHAHLPLSVDDILQQVPTGRRTLERRCRKALGWGIGQEIRRTHLERARRLLAGTELPLKTVATQAGFADYHRLAVVFRQEFGLSPTAYRRQIRSPLTR